MKIRKMQPVVGYLLLSSMLLSACAAPGVSTERSAPTQAGIPTETASLLPAPSPTPTLIPYNGSVKISGYVMDESGRPVELSVSFQGFDLGDLGFVNTNASGYYEKELAPALQYIVSAEPGPDQHIGKYTFPAGYLPQSRLVIRDGSQARLDFVVRSGGTLWLKAYTASGAEMTWQDFMNPYQVGAYPTGTFPYSETIQAEYGGIPLFRGWLQDSNRNIPCLMLPPSEPADIWAVWRLPEVGTTFLHADNNGQGFVAEKDGVTPVDLVYEFAKTEYREASQKLQELQGSGYIFSNEISNLLANALQNLNLAENEQVQGSESSSAVYSYKVLTQVIKAKEGMVLERARQDIETSRKGNITVTLTDDHGNPLPNAIVEYEQVSHDFVFSSGFSYPENYAALKAAGFEYTFFQTWWGMMETSPGSYNFPDASVSQQQRAGFGYLVETGPTLSPSMYIGAPGFPVFAANESPEELSAHIRQFSYDLVTHYKGIFRMYDAFLEPDLLQAFNFTLPELVDFVKSSMQGAKQADPRQPTYVLVAVPIFNSMLNSRGSYSVLYSPEGDLRAAYESPAHSGYEFVQALEAAGAPFDTIGLEYYYGTSYPPIDLSLFADSLDFNSTLGKKIFIGELAYSSLDGFSDVHKNWEFYGGWHAGYTDQTQAEWATDTLTIAFSKPYVNGYEWGVTNDNGTDYYMVGMGLFHMDHVTQRPALAAIHGLITSWTTSGSGVTDAAAGLTFRGFGGEYELKITTADGRTLYARTHITEQETNQIHVTVDTTTPVFRSVTIDPNSVKNGDYFEITADAGETGLEFTADISQLDSTKMEPIVLDPQPGGIYTARIQVSIANSAANGSKTIYLTAVDNGRNTSTKTAQVELNNPAPALDKNPPNDEFNGTALDATKWSLYTSGGSVGIQAGRLALSTGSQPVTSTAAVYPNWEFTGDFDVQVDFQAGAGWPNPAENKHIDLATFGVNIAGNCVNMVRVQSGGGDAIVVWNCEGYEEGKVYSSAVAVKFRVIRIGTALTFLYDAGSGWQELASVTVPPNPAQISMAVADYEASQAFTTYFDNFHINSGLTTYRP